MKAFWVVSNNSMLYWRQLVKENRTKRCVVERRRKNIDRMGIVLSKQEIWRTIVGCQITTQQRSDPNSLASIFLGSKSPALNLIECRAATSVGKLIEIECAKLGLRRSKIISKNLSEIFDYLETGGWVVSALA